MRIAAKNEGSDMPMVVINNVNLLRNLVLMTAAKIPITRPKAIAIEMDTAAKSRVFGKASPKMSETFRLLWYDILKYGALSTMAIDPTVASLA